MVPAGLYIPAARPALAASAAVNATRCLEAFNAAAVTAVVGSTPKNGKADAPEPDRPGKLPASSDMEADIAAIVLEEMSVMSTRGLSTERATRLRFIWSITMRSSCRFFFLVMLDEL